jgi:hypothetical protein
MVENKYCLQFNANALSDFSIFRYIYDGSILVADFKELSTQHHTAQTYKWQLSLQRKTKTCNHKVLIN